ncbi:hypothetical protein [Frankia sp. CiP3]|uniref:hypothetical protein n=1 Tax=Frankia sp. CiP3 TaxID=2880971 RepID=UPI001EF6094F|nr:hypothetical protein [Frankia sp. CiP3]
MATSVRSLLTPHYSNLELVLVNDMMGGPGTRPICFGGLKERHRQRSASCRYR